MKAAIIFNPQAGTRDLQRQIQDAGQYLQKEGWEIGWHETAHAGHATQLASEAAERNDDIAVAVGGDGTLNEVMNGLVYSNTALGILPAGTGNVFAAEINIPSPAPLPLPDQALKKAAESLNSPLSIPEHSLKRAAQSLIKGSFKQIDVARATFEDGEVRHFMLWSGIGLDSTISYSFELDKRHHPKRKALGMFAWFITGLSVMRDFRGKVITVSTDTTQINDRIILTTINNSQLYGRFWRLSPDAKLDDGFLDVVVMRGHSLLSSITHITLATLGLHRENPDVETFRTTRIYIDAEEPIPVHLDAENVGFTPVTIEILPKALRLRVPPEAPEYLFSS